LNANVAQTNCTFCQRSEIASYILKETQNFCIVADHAPLVEGHLLIIPKTHYACYGAAPASVDTELQTLKQKVRAFFDRFYATPIIFWEHGIFRQTVFHAHLHCFPFREVTYNLTEGLHDLVVSSQEDLRTWYANRGHYFYLEDPHHALLFSPDTDRYFHVIRKILWAGAAAHNGNTQWRSAQQRHEEGKALIPQTIARWQQFQQQEVDHAS
jgi:diadenosine tetraphosphate (Ap4A) HIT family hydrolase